MVEKDGKRWLDRDAALELWNRNTRPTHNAKISQPDAIEASPPADASELKRRIQELPEDQIPALHESRARREHYQAEKARLEALQQRGELVSAAEVQAEAFRCARTTRDRLLALPARLAPELSQLRDTKQVFVRLQEEITNALRALATRQTEPADAH